MLKSIKLLTSLAAAIALAFSGVLPASAAQVGLQNFSDPLDSAGISDILDVQVNSSDEDPTMMNIYLTFDDVVAADDFVDDVWASIDIDTDGDGNEDYWVGSGYEPITPQGESKTIWNSAMEETGCEATFFGFPDDQADYVGFEIDTTCLVLPETFGINAYVVDHADESFDFAPDDGFYDVTNPTGAQNLLALTKTPTPTITGNATVGSKLTAKPGTWDSGVALTYQWLRQGVAVATGATYTTSSSDLGKSITVAVTGTKSGYKSATTTSTPVIVSMPALSKTVTPTIKGATKAGSTLTANTGQWDAGVAFAFQWLRDGAIIANQTSTTYLATADDIGRGISVRVVGSKTGYLSSTLTSAVAVIQASVLSKTPTPSLSGTTKAGQTLTAKPGTWDSGVKLTYQWLRNGVAIKGATKATYKLTSSDKGKKIIVKVTGSKTGYLTVVKTSAAKTISK